MSATKEKLKNALLSMLPVIYVTTWEEERAEKAIAEISQTAFKSPIPVYIWSAALGIIDHDGKVIADMKNPADALAWTQAQGKTAFHIYRDLHHWLKDPVVERRVREIYRIFYGTFRRLIIISPRLEIPIELEKEINVFDFPLPGLVELKEEFETAKANYEKLHRKSVSATDEIMTRLFNTALGLISNEARNAFYMGMKPVLDEESVAAVLHEKKQLIRKSGVLEYVDHGFVLDDVGGLQNLKEWLRKRSAVFHKDAKEAGLSAPKGVLMTGISGCGKSLCVQAIAAYWNLPLIRLDLNLVYAGVINNPEETLDRALRITEAMSPCVLWIDEIEKGVSRTPTGSAVGPTARIFSRFLTWMQEKQGLVFIAATANEIDLLAPEFLRKGRFDEIFFVDLPNEAERGQIFAVHLRKRNQDITKFDLTTLGKATRDFSGAEIEQVIVSGLYEAFDQNRPLEERDIFSAIGRSIPLATTMAEDIKKIKRWALDRAVKASK